VLCSHASSLLLSSADHFVGSASGWGRGFWIFELLGANATAMMASIDAIKDLKEKLKLSQQLTEEMFIGSDDDDSDDVK